MGCEVGEHRALACFDHETVTENVRNFAGNGNGVMVGHRKFLG
jgi:hypothetical protein